MADHYYSRKPEVESDPTFFNVTLRGHSFRFKTDRGVFSRKEIDFGSRLLIDTFEEPEMDGPLLDIGCGYGPIGVSLAKSFPDRPVHLIDINERALQLAKENATINEVPNVQVYESDRFEQVEEENFAAIITNPPIRAGKRVVFELFEQSYLRLKKKGELWIVIQKKQGAPSAKTKLEETFDGHVEIKVRKKGYFIIKAIKI